MIFRQTPENGDDLGFRVTNAQEEGFAIHFVSQLGQSQVMSAQEPLVLHLDADVFHHIQLEINNVEGQPIGWQFGCVEATDEFLLFVNGNVVVS